jgi:hypothetical protein
MARAAFLLVSDKKGDVDVVDSSSGSDCALVAWVGQQQYHGWFYPYSSGDCHYCGLGPGYTGTLNGRRVGYFEKRHLSMEV